MSDGNLTITIDDHKNKTYSPDPVSPDDNNNIHMAIISSGTKTWVFKDPPITIANPTDFSWSPQNGGGTTLTVSDSEADRVTTPKHVYTVHVENNAGESMDIDPKIQDR